MEFLWECMMLVWKVLIGAMLWTIALSIFGFVTAMLSKFIVALITETQGGK